ncbi:IclR family transcriptional regulator [Achromobacter sp. SIMBA_011]|jgi:DNA-binding IclR family transcriptional regulator|uniref:IclR family transcriptional regulator n=1 Tax=Achromobacter TaxID=222 RepID=UPI0009B6C255|nr:MULTISPECIES: IclR family transcriptional regulator [Achromobacter]MCZ8409174.1 IclR family transcriptional regulator [Achromobacter dolens]
MNETSSSAKSDNDVRAVVRALSIFDAFDASRPSLSLQEIGGLIGMPKATTFRLVNTLNRAGFLVRMDDQRYCLSGKFTRLGNIARGKLNVRDAALPVMVEVNRLTGETITLNVASQSNRVCLEVVDTPAPLMAIVRPGEHVPILFGATGRILLASMTNEQLNDLLGSSKEGQELDGDALRRELQRYRSQGYAMTRGQRIPGVTSIAVPLVTPQMPEQYCLALTGPSVRVDAREAEFIELMLGAGQQVSTLLGAKALAHQPTSAPSVTPGKTRASNRPPAT